VSKLETILPTKVLETTDAAYDITKQLKDLYKKLIQSDVPKEDARMLLPQGLETEMCMDMNFRSLRHFLKLRLDKHAQWEIRQVAKEILFICQDKWPWLVEDFS
jgi:thymidylate synthase (FAD)